MDGSELTSAGVRSWLWLAVLIHVLFAASPVWAHAALISTDPADGTLLQAAPQHLVLHFSEPVSPLVISLIQPDGSRAVLGQWTSGGSDLSTDAPEGLGNGTYVLSWRVVSEDGHPVGGSVVFAIATHTATPTGAAATPNSGVWLLLWLGKVLFYVGLFAGVGGAFSRNWLFQYHRPAGREVALSLVLGVLSIPVLLAGQGLDALAVPVSYAGRPEVWSAAVNTSLGPAVVVATCAFGAAALSFIAAKDADRLLALLALMAAGIALACTGHASSAEPHLLTRSLVALHGMTIAFWIGALMPLRAALTAPPAVEITALERFSRFIPAILVALILAGVGLAVVQLGSPAALWATPYGRLLLLKLVLVALLLLIGAWNRWRLTVRASLGDLKARVSMRQLIAFDLGLALLLFATVAGWRFTPPPRTLIEASQTSAHLHGAGAMVQVTARPNHPGPVTLEILTMKHDGTSLSAKQVNISLSMPAVGIEPIRREAVSEVAGTWIIQGAVIPLPGEWSIEVNVLVSDFEQAKFSGTLTFR